MIAVTDDPDYKGIGETLAEIRKSRNLSVSQLAIDSDLIRGSIDGIEKATRRLDIIEMCKLADALDISHTDLFVALTQAYRENRGQTHHTPEG